MPFVRTASPVAAFLLALPAGARAVPYAPLTGRPAPPAGTGASGSRAAVPATPESAAASGRRSSAIATERDTSPMISINRKRRASAESASALCAI